MDGIRRAARAIRRAASGLASFLRELDYWQRRTAILSLAPDRYVAHPNRAPDTYGEFLARTTGPLLREPSSRARLAGRQVG
jgi:hypothetical protein